MQTEEAKDNGTEGRYAVFGCCNPEDFKKMFETQCRCFCDQGNATNFSAMKEGMMKKMMGMWCGDGAEKTKKNTESQKKPEGSGASAENQCECF